MYMSRIATRVNRIALPRKNGARPSLLSVKYSCPSLYSYRSRKALVRNHEARLAHSAIVVVHEMMLLRRHGSHKQHPLQLVVLFLIVVVSISVHVWPGKQVYRKAVHGTDCLWIATRVPQLFHAENAVLSSKPGWCAVHRSANHVVHPRTNLSVLVNLGNDSMDTIIACLQAKTYEARSIDIVLTVTAETLFVAKTSTSDSILGFVFENTNVYLCIFLEEMKEELMLNEVLQSFIRTEFISVFHANHPYQLLPAQIAYLENHTDVDIVSINPCRQNSTEKLSLQTTLPFSSIIFPEEYIEKEENGDAIPAPHLQTAVWRNRLHSNLELYFDPNFGALGHAEFFIRCRANGGIHHVLDIPGASTAVCNGTDGTPTNANVMAAVLGIGNSGKPLPWYILHASLLGGGRFPSLCGTINCNLTLTTPQD